MGTRQLDQHLSGGASMWTMLNKISSSLYALRQMSGTCSTESLKTFYFTLINSHLSHGIIICIWATSKSNEYLY